MYMREKFDKDDRLIGTISSDRGEYPAKGELTTGAVERPLARRLTDPAF